MTKNTEHVIHIHSKQVIDNKPKLPTQDKLDEGEIAVNYGENVETLSIKNESGTVVTFSSDNYYTEQKLGSAFTGSNSATTVTDVLNSLEVGEEVEVNSGNTPTGNTIELWIDESIEPVTVEVYTKAETNSLLAEKVNTRDVVTAITSDNSGSTAPIATKVIAENTMWNANGYYSTCATAGGTAAKTVDISGFILNENRQVSVLFTNGFTVSNPTLNINNTGAHAIKIYGSAIPMGKVDNNTILTMIYDGTNYNVISIESQTVPTSDAIDLGLPSGLLWCDHNVGASKPEEEGFFFSWGNIEGHNLNGQDTYDFGTSNNTDPYASSSGATISYPGSIAVGDTYDMARANMGAPWRLPTNTEFQELYDNCTNVWINQNGINGRRFTSNVNGNSIFFPAAGHYNGSSHHYEGSRGYYWFSVLRSADRAYRLSFSSEAVGPQGNEYRFYGFSVRAVQ